MTAFPRRGKAERTTPRRKASVAACGRRLYRQDNDTPALNALTALIEASGGVYYDNKLFIAKPDGSPQRRDRMSANFGQLIRHLEMPHIRFHDLRHTAATNMHQLTGDFYTVGEILGHTLKGICITSCETIPEFV